MQSLPYQLLPALTTEEYQALRDDIERRGVLVPIEFDEQGAVLDGHHRLEICQELAITEYPSVVRKGLTEPEKRQHVRALNLLRRHLSREQQQRITEDAVRDAPQKSNRQIAAELGVDDKTVGAARGRLIATAEIPQLDRTIGADGKSRPVERQRPTVSSFTPELEYDPEEPPLDLEVEQPVEVNLPSDEEMIAAFPVLAALERGDTELAMKLAREELDSPGDAAVSQRPTPPAPAASITHYPLRAALAAQGTQAAGLAAHIEGIVNCPLVVAEYRQNVRDAKALNVYAAALPILDRIQRSIPAALALLEELARKD